MNFISCPRHAYQNISFLYLSSENVDILCENCLQDNIIPNELFKINKLISINILLSKPETIMQKLDLGRDISNAFQSSSKYTSQLLEEQIRQMEKQLQMIQEQIQNTLQEFKCCIQNLLGLRKQLLESINHGLNFDQLKELLNELKVKDDDTNPDAIEQLKLKLFQYFSCLQKDNAKMMNEIIVENIIQVQENEDQEIKKLQTLKYVLTQLEMMQNNQTKTVSAILPQIPKSINSIVLTKDYSTKIINLIKERQKCQISFVKLIYLGSRDGLNAQSFWSKVNGKKNLLMIFKSKNNYIFGAYSPCQWQQNLRNYVQDNTGSSFLFSQTHDEIYPILDNRYAIYCRPDYGPTFGAGHNIHISADFQGGSSRLGSYYQEGMKCKGQYSTQLFGESTPNVIECEIFQIITK